MKGPASDYAILGMLSVEPMSGYEIKKAIEGTIAHFWRESFGQIYPALKRLTEERLIVAADAKQGLRQRRRYALTAAGRARLRKWLQEAAEPQPPRNAVLLKLFFGRSAPLASAKKHVSEVRRRRQETLAALTVIHREIQAESGDRLDAPYWAITLNHGLHHARAELRWCDETLAALDALEKHRAKGKTNRP